MKIKLIGIAALALAAAGCVNVDATRLSANEILPARLASEVTIYTSRESIKQPYREIALLEANGDGTTTSERVFYESMRKRAAKLGANGLVLEPGLEPGPAIKIAATVFDVQYTRYRHAVAILVDETAAR